MKKILLFLLVMTLVFACSVGCTDSSDETKPTTAPTQAPTQAPTPEVTTAPSSDPTPMPEPVDAPVADILDIRFENGAPVNKTSNAATFKTYGSPVVDTDSTINMTVATFDGSSAFAIENIGDYYDLLEKGFTMEIYFSIADTTNEVGIVANMEKGGFGFDYVPGNSSFGFNVYTGSYTHPYYTSPAETDVYYHVVATYDCSDICLFVDGKYDNECETGDVIFPEETSQRLVIGADSTSNGVEGNFTGSIAFVRIYSSILSDAQIDALYNSLGK